MLREPSVRTCLSSPDARKFPQPRVYKRQKRPPRRAGTVCLFQRLGMCVAGPMLEGLCPKGQSHTVVGRSDLSPLPGHLRCGTAPESNRNSPINSHGTPICACQCNRHQCITAQIGMQAAWVVFGNPGGRNMRGMCHKKSLGKALTSPWGGDIVRLVQAHAVMRLAWGACISPLWRVGPWQ